MKDRKEVFYPAEIGPGLMCSTCLPLTWGLSIGGNGSELKQGLERLSRHPVSLDLLREVHKYKPQMT